MSVTSSTGKRRLFRQDRRGAIAIVFALSAIPVLITVGAGLDMARLAAGRAALQTAVDNAALSGAAAYTAYTQGDTLNPIAVTAATSAFCNASRMMPQGFAVSATGGGKACNAGLPGPAVTAQIAGYNAGTPGIAAGSGCSATHSVSQGYTCGLVVTVTATATTSTILAKFIGAWTTISATGMAANPFINLGSALSSTVSAFAWNANSLWVYPLLLDANGSPDFSTNPGALPDSSQCTGDPSQTVCGNYTMIASTKYANCTTANPCTVNGTVFGGSGGVVQNPSASQSVITATTPIGIAMASASGGSTTFGYFGGLPQPKNGCSWPAETAYQTASQTYDNNGNPQIPWTTVTHWFYSSYLTNNLPPDQAEIAAQSSYQFVASVPAYGNGSGQAGSRANPSTCSNDSISNWATSGNIAVLATTYPTGGNTNCNLYIVKNPSSTSPNPSYKNNNVCFTPTATQGRQYASLSCQAYSGAQYGFFWNDMGGTTDDTDYGNGTLVVTCDATAKVVLID